jgi:hypothetical protein
LALDTSALERKIEAFNLLFEISFHTGKSFFPYVENTLKLVNSYFSFKHSQHIREKAVSIVNHLLLACSEEN